MVVWARTNNMGMDLLGVGVGQGSMAHVNEGKGEALLGCMERHGLHGKVQPGCIVRHR